MRLSTRARYAFHCMTAVSRLQDGGAPVTAERIAQETGKPKRYLEQIIHLLKKDSLLQSTSGRKGGYHLARPADKISLKDIIDATIGPIGLVECVLRPEECSKSDCCELRLIYLIMSQCIYQVLGRYTLADLDDGDLLAIIARDLQRRIAESARNGQPSPLTPDLIPSRFRES